MTVKTQGFYWHVHHDELIEWCYDYEERARYIHTDKPENEQAIRLRLFQPIKGNLPNEVIEATQAHIKTWQAYVKAWQAYVKATQVYNKAGQFYDKASQAYIKTWQAYNKARQAYNKTNQACLKVWQASSKVLSDNMSAIEELHAVECTNCPWDGHTIFPNT